ncbi:hypothetical protein BC828DRAFT_374585 [Blastocladiella britannica]|nr:hypothetical protein BC828DRAFT_374585 [Blastocladiella britannica]
MSQQQRQQQQQGGTRPPPRLPRNNSGGATVRNNALLPSSNPLSGRLNPAGHLHQAKHALPRSGSFGSFGSTGSSTLNVAAAPFIPGGGGASSGSNGSGPGAATVAATTAAARDADNANTGLTPADLADYERLKREHEEYYTAEKDRKKSMSEGHLVGQCTTKCSRYEYLRRITMRELDSFELDRAGNPCFDRFVKKFTRSSAGELQHPGELRTPEALRDTFDHLLTIVDEVGFASAYKFVADRIRAGLRDSWTQQTWGPMAISLYEQAVRFHLVSFLLRPDAMDWMQDVSRLNAALSSLLDHYSMSPGSSPNEFEFRCYDTILYCGIAGRMDRLLAHDARNVPTNNAYLRAATRVAPILSHSLLHAQGARAVDVSRFMAAMRVAPLGIAAAAALHLDRVRRDALRDMVLSGHKIRDRPTVLTLMGMGDLVATLRFADAAQARAFCAVFKVFPTGDPDSRGSEVVEFHRDCGFEDTDIHLTKPESTKMRPQFMDFRLNAAAGFSPSHFIRTGHDGPGIELGAGVPPVSNGLTVSSVLSGFATVPPPPSNGFAFNNPPSSTVAAAAAVTTPVPPFAPFAPSGFTFPVPQPSPQAVAPPPPPPPTPPTTTLFNGSSQGITFQPFAPPTQFPPPLPRGFTFPPIVTTTAVTTATAPISNTQQPHVPAPPALPSQFTFQPFVVPPMPVPAIPPPLPSTAAVVPAPPTAAAAPIHQPLAAPPQDQVEVVQELAPDQEPDTTSDASADDAAEPTHEAGNPPQPPSLPRVTLADIAVSASASATPPSTSRTKRRRSTDPIPSLVDTSATDTDQAHMRNGMLPSATKRARRSHPTTTHNDDESLRHQADVLSSRRIQRAVLTLWRSRTRAHRYTQRAIDLPDHIGSVADALYSLRPDELDLAPNALYRVPQLVSELRDGWIRGLWPELGSAVAKWQGVSRAVFAPWTVIAAANHAVTCVREIEVAGNRVEAMARALLGQKSDGSLGVTKLRIAASAAFQVPANVPANRTAVAARPVCIRAIKDAVRVFAETKIPPPPPSPTRDTDPENDVEDPALAKLLRTIDKVPLYNMTLPFFDAMMPALELLRDRALRADHGGTGDGAPLDDEYGVLTGSQLVELARSVQLAMADLTTFVVGSGECVRAKLTEDVGAAHVVEKSDRK